MVMLNFTVLNQIMLRFDMFVNLRAHLATVKWQLQLAIIYNSVDGVEF